jgi:tetratricopeptide (TPR) repeat protein
MTSSRQTTLVSAALLATCMAASVLLLKRVDAIRPQVTADEVLYVPSAKILKRLSLGYEGLLADIYWTRAVQYFGIRHAAGATEFKLLAPLLDIATKLDPHLVVAYDFGATFLSPDPPNGAGDPRAAIRLTEYGLENNPDAWHLYYNLGFIYYLDLKDYKKASAAFEKGATIPGAHPYLRVLAAQMAGHAGEPETAKLLWVTTYQTSNDKDIRANAIAHIRALQVYEDVIKLEGLIAQFRQTTGHFPATFAELPGIRGVPKDPLGQPYKLTAEGHVEVRRPDDFPFITAGAPPGYVPGKPKFLPGD